MFGRQGKQALGQQAGPESENLQAGRDIVVVNHGSSPEEVRDIVTQAIKSNSLEMRAVAAQVVEERIERFSDMLVERLSQEASELTTATSDPDVQYAIVQAGIGYARTGDEDMAGVLVDLLADRARVETRSLLAVVIDDAVSVAPRLTDGEVAILTIFWRLVHTQNQGLVDLQSLATWLRTDIVPLVSYLPTGDASYLHLQALGCANVQVTQIAFHQVWSVTYPALFTEGFVQEDIPEDVQTAISGTDVLIRSLRDAQRFQVNALNADHLEQQWGDRFESDTIEFLKGFLQRTLSDDALVAALEEVDPVMRQLYNVWNSTPMQSLRLSAVGMAIAHSNWRYLTGATAPLSIWISEDAGS